MTVMKEECPSAALMKEMSCELMQDAIVVNNDLRITFERTIRVPNNEQVSLVLPNLGCFPLRSISQYADKIIPEMAAKGGLFLPMYLSEAMRINFKCDGKQDYMIKIYVDGVNAISGEPAIEDSTTKLRRQATAAAQLRAFDQTSLLQDYLVEPGQHWLNGITDFSGNVRQFIVTPFGSFDGTEQQVTRKGSSSEIQIEVTPYNNNCPPTPQTTCDHPVFVKTLTGKVLTIMASATDTIHTFKCRVEDKEGIPPDKQQLSWVGRQLKDHLSISDYNIDKHAILYLMPHLRGSSEQMRIDKGMLSQVINEDMKGTDWLSGKTTVFNVQVLNSASYRAITGEDPPHMPPTAAIYEAHGFPFFKLYEEPTYISGDFSNVQSGSQSHGSNTATAVSPDPLIPNKGTCKNEPTTLPVIGITNPNGPLRSFRTVRDLEKEFSR